MLVTRTIAGRGGGGTTGVVVLSFIGCQEGLGFFVVVAGGGRHDGGGVCRCVGKKKAMWTYVVAYRVESLFACRVLASFVACVCACVRVHRRVEQRGVSVIVWLCVCVGRRVGKQKDIKIASKMKSSNRSSSRVCGCGLETVGKEEENAWAVNCSA
jgi:hypothetical protein